MEKLPKGVISVLRTLESCGGEAWLVGGCVRDRLLGRPVHDWDICTSLHPEAVMAAFSHTVPTGLRHGTVTVLWDDIPYEVTTYRTDGVYRDHRRPEQVTFASALWEDLSRRDFTVNAMAMGLDGSLVDLFCGREDLHRRVIRCVGVPERRFTEDALRILRAVRFSAQLGFSIAPETAQAMEQCSACCAALSAERIRDEVEKILCSGQPERLQELLSLGVLERFGCADAGGLEAVGTLPPDRKLRWAALLRAAPGLDLRALRLDHQTVRLCEGALACFPVPEDRIALKRLAAEHGRDCLRCAAMLCGRTETVEAVLQSGECIDLKELAVSGRDFPSLHGPALGAHLRALQVHVWACPEDNTRESLLAYTEKTYKKV